MDEPFLPLPGGVPRRRVRKIPKGMAEIPGFPGDLNGPNPIEDKPVPAHTILSANDVIQIIAGEHRGVLAQVADFDGKIYRVYRINPPDPPTVFSVAANDLKFIGPGKVASRNPLAALEPKPEMDRPLEDERDM